MASFSAWLSDGRPSRLSLRFCLPLSLARAVLAGTMVLPVWVQVAVEAASHRASLTLFPVSSCRQLLLVLAVLPYLERQTETQVARLLLVRFCHAPAVVVVCRRRAETQPLQLEVLEALRPLPLACAV